MAKQGFNRRVTCAICGKEFCPSSDYVYKKKDSKTGKVNYCCSYTCFRKLEKQIESKKKKYVTRTSFYKGDW